MAECTIPFVAAIATRERVRLRRRNRSFGRKMPPLETDLWIADDEGTKDLAAALENWLRGFSGSSF